jgi:hypothetical protein
MRRTNLAIEKAVRRECKEIVAHLRAIAKRRLLDARKFASKKLGNAYSIAATCIREAEVYAAAAEQVEMRAARPSANFFGKGRKRTM